MAAAVVQSACVGVGSGSTVTVTLTNTTVAGNYLIAFVGRYITTTDGSPAVNDNNSQTYTLYGTEHNAGGSGTNGYGTGVWYSKITAGKASHAVTYHGGNDAYCMTVYEVSGLDATNPSSVSPSWTFTSAANSATQLGSAAITPAANDIVFAMGTNSGNGTQTQIFSALTGGGTWTLPSTAKDDSTTTGPEAAGYQVVGGSPVSMSATYNTQSGSNEGITVGIMSLKAAAGAVTWTPAHELYPAYQVL